MLKIRILTPFRYQYTNPIKKQPNKDYYFAAGDYYHLLEDTDRKEIEHILSPNFAFKNYIHIDQTDISKDLKEKVNKDNGFVIMNDYADEDVKETKEYYQYSPDSDVAPTIEPSKNRFDKTTEKQIEQPVLNEMAASSTYKAKPEPEPEPEPEVEVEVEAEDKEDSVDTTELETESKESEEEVVEELGELNKEEREEELKQLHYTKLKEIAEEYNLSYTDKKTSIKDILSIEYQ